jgi:hypothetical protein
VSLTEGGAGVEAVITGGEVAGSPVGGEASDGGERPEAGGSMGGGEAGAPVGGVVEPPAPTPPEECFTHEDYFAEKAWAEVLRPTCLDCHNPQGAALTTDFVLQRDEMPGAMEHNYEAFAHIAAFDQSGFPLVLLKPMNRLPHGGGELIQEGDASYQILMEMVE